MLAGVLVGVEVIVVDVDEYEKRKRESMKRVDGGGQGRDRGLTALRSASCSDRSELYTLLLVYQLAQLWNDVRWAEHWNMRQVKEGQPRVSI